MADRHNKARPIAAVLNAFADAAGELLAHPECPAFLQRTLEEMKGEAFNQIQSKPRTVAEKIAAERGMFRLFLPWCKSPHI